MIDTPQHKSRKGLAMKTLTTRLRNGALLAACMSLSGVLYAAEKPNIILILSDDFGYGDAGAYGGGEGRGMATPSLDRMAHEGMLFYTNYAQPSCTPGRAAVLPSECRNID